MAATRSGLRAMLRALLDEGYELTFAKDPAGCGYLADLTGPLGSRTTGIGDTPAQALASVWPLDNEGDRAVDEHTHSTPASSTTTTTTT